MSAESKIAGDRISAAQLAEIEKRANDATEGPWYPTTEPYPLNADLEFIAASRTDVPALCDEIRAAWGEAEVATRALRDVLAVIDGDEPDYSDCPWRRGEGICISGCSQEPACADAGDGWPIEKARALVGSENARRSSVRTQESASEAK
jgi:hypothetical protein